LATKWLVLEADTARAFSFLDRHSVDLAAPELLLSEVGGVIVRHANMRLITADQASAMLEKWTSMWRDGLVRPFNLTPKLIGEAGEIAFALGHPLPDCIYLALAIGLEGSLATCDAKFHAKAAPHFPQVKLLDDFDLA
jgi:predicted nucleic acid-binding protein